MSNVPMIRTAKDEGESHKEDRATLPQQRAGLVELTEAEIRVVAGGGRRNAIDTLQEI